MRLSRGKDGVARLGEADEAADSGPLPMGKEVCQYFKIQNGCLGGASAESQPVSALPFLPLISLIPAQTAQAISSGKLLCLPGLPLFPAPIKEPVISSVWFHRNSYISLLHNFVYFSVFLH